jgi:hypothetical protein
LEETHQVFSKTKRGTRLPGKRRGKRQWVRRKKSKSYEKHQVLQKSKNRIVQGSRYITKKCRSVGRSTMM